MNETAPRSRRRRAIGIVISVAMVLFGPLSLLVGSAGSARAGTVNPLSPTPTAVAFGNQRVGTVEPTAKVLTLTNNTSSTITVHSADNTGDNPGDFFGFTGDDGNGNFDATKDCLRQPDGVTDRQLTAGQSCTFLVFAYPSATGTRTATLNVRDAGGNVLVGVALSVTGTEGYYIGGAFGEVSKFGDAIGHGDATNINLNAPIVDIQQVPFSEGYWLMGGDGGVFSYGPDAHFLGSTGGKKLNAPVIAMSPVDPDGYYMAATDGGVFAFGRDAPFQGSMGGKPLNAPIVGIAVDPVDFGYWLVASDGGVFAFGHAPFRGSMGGKHLNQPIVGIVPGPDGDGYWLVAADGGVFAFNEPFVGSRGGKPLNSDIVDLAASPLGAGYWMLAGDGGVFAFGDAEFHGNVLNQHVDDAIGITGTAPPTVHGGIGQFIGYSSENPAFTGASFKAQRFQAMYKSSAARHSNEFALRKFS